MGEENNVRDVVDAVAGFAKAVPVYQDIVQPAAQELGKALQTVAKTVHIALAPVSALVPGCHTHAQRTWMEAVKA